LFSQYDCPFANGCCNWANCSAAALRPSCALQVCLTFHPEGAEWDEPEPVIISEGFLGSTAGVESTARQLPSSFSVSYTNSQASRGLKLRISMQKHIDTELLTSQRLRAAAAKAAAAGASSSAAAAAVLRDSHPEAWRMSYGTALAQGRPLTLSLSVPVWVVNGTQLPIAVGIVPITTAAGGTGDTGLPATGDPATGSSSSSSQDPSISSSQGVGHLRVMDTEAFTSVTRPSDQVVIMGNSIELMSYPPDPLAQDSSSMRPQLTVELGAAGGVVTQWAAVFSIMGSRWSTPMVLSTAGAAAPGVSGDSPVADAVSRLPRYDPVLIRARCRDGSVYEVTVRLESAGTGLPLATLVRLDPHMVVSNRTGYTLHMLQPEPIWKALGSAQSNSTWLLSSGSGRVSNQGAWIASAPSGAPGTYGSTGSSRATPSSSSTSSNRPQQLGSAASAAHEATLVLRPGALAVPLSWPAGASRRLLALTLPPRVGRSSGGSGAAAAVAAAAAAAELSQQLDPSMWSEPFKVSYPATGVMQVLLPLYQLGTPGEPQSVDATSIAAALGAFRKLFQPQQQQQQGKDSGGGQAGLPPKPPSTSRGAASIQQQQEAAGHDNAPMLVHVAKQSEAGLLEYLAVTVNVSVEMPTPGCLHLVLQSLGGEPQQCLMNCTPSAISFRQATPRSAWQLLPPYSATALVLLQPPDVLSGLAGGSTDPLQLPSCSEVMLRDSDPATSGMAVCTFDTDSSGMPTAQAAKQRSGSSGGGSQRGGVVASSSEAPAVFPVHGGDKQALAQVRPYKQQMHSAGQSRLANRHQCAVGSILQYTAPLEALGCRD
jgi:vacuolar protein sorting-associated protein 13A/C